MKRSLLGACLLGVATWALPQTANALPPPSVTLDEAAEVTPTAVLFDAPLTAIAPHEGEDTFTSAMGYHFVAYWDAGYTLCLARRPATGGAWTTITLTGTTLVNQDSHRTTHVQISPNDGRIHLTYGHHYNPIRYRMSVPGAATFSNANFTLANVFPSPSGNERNYLKTGEPIVELCYPKFAVQENSNKLMLFWMDRDGASSRSVYRLSTYDDNGDWSTGRLIVDGKIGTYVDPTGISTINSTSRRIYSDDLATFGDDIFLTWCWAENSRSAGRGLHDLVYAKSADGGVTWTNTAGNGMTLPLHLNSPGIVAQEIDYEHGLYNGGDSAIDSSGRAHVVRMHNSAPGGPFKYQHYCRLGTTWQRTTLPPSPWLADSRPRVFVDRTYNTVYVVVTISKLIKIYAAQQIADTSEINWTKWTERYSGTQQYVQLGHGEISDDGSKLWIVAQRSGSGSGATESRLDVLQFSLDPNP